MASLVLATQTTVSSTVALPVFPASVLVAVLVEAIPGTAVDEDTLFMLRATARVVACVVPCEVSAGAQSHQRKIPPTVNLQITPTITAAPFLGADQTAAATPTTIFPATCFPNTSVPANSAASEPSEQAWVECERHTSS
jgi:hypothetical protein